MARFSITEFGVRNPDQCLDCANETCPGNTPCVNCLACFEAVKNSDRVFNLRPPAVGLLTPGPISTSSMVFVLLMLSSVTFDGLLATSLWAWLAEWMIYSGSMRPLLIALQDITGNAVAAAGTIALIGFLLVFQLLYLLFSTMMYAAIGATARHQVSVLQIARLFVLSLVPIALAYHLAHYLSYLAIVAGLAVWSS